MTSSKKINHIITLGIISISVITISLVFFSLRGTTTTSGDYPKSTANRSLSCSSNKTIYPYADYDNSEKKLLTINVLFDIKLKNISLAYDLYYDDGELITTSEAKNHASMNISFNKIGIQSEKLSPNYSRQNNKMQMTLFTKAGDFNEAIARYYMADYLNINSSLDDFMNNYRQQGFECAYWNN